LLFSLQRKTEEKAKDEVDKYADRSREKEDNNEKQKHSILFEKEDGPFTNRYERIEEFRTIKRRYWQKIETTQNDIPENHKEKESKKNIWQW